MGPEGNYIVWSCEWFCLCSHFLGIYVYVSAQGRGRLEGRVRFLKRVFPSTSVCWCVHTVIRHCLTAAACL